MDLNDYPTTPKTLPWKPIALIAGGVVVLVVIAIVVVRLVKGGNQESFLLEGGGRASEGTLDARAARQAAGECDALAQQEERDNCYWGLARDANDAAYCVQVSDAAGAARCQDDVLQRAAFASGDAALCEAIADASRREGCAKTLSDTPTPIPELEECAILEDEIERDSCFELARTAQSEGRPPDWVGPAPGEQPIEESDTDEDGLEDLMELTVYFTDPLNPDTDGDGYLDGAEVAAGYNPNGEGRLNSSQPL